MFCRRQSVVVSPVTICTPKSDIESRQQLQQFTKRFLASGTENMADNPFQSWLPGVPQPTLAFFVANKRPHLVHFANELNLQVIQRQRCYIPRREFFKVRTTALILICKARAVSRIPALFIARSTIWSFIPGELLSNLVYEAIRQRSDLMLHLPPVRRL